MRRKSLESGIYVVATPIGNLSDITHRAIEVLSGVDLIAAEDTRHSKKLLDHYGVSKSIVSLHEHNEAQKSQMLIDKVLSGQSIALISDAGTPLISDPGHILIKLARDHAVRLIPIPGPSALTAAISVAGIASSSFIFEGFLPAKRNAKRDILESVSDERRTVVFYESPHRIVSTIEVMDELYPDRDLVVARELTKRFETIKRASVAEILVWMKGDDNQQKGEFVLLLAGVQEADEGVDLGAQKVALSRALIDLPPKKAVALVVDIFGGSKKELYDLAIKIKNKT